MPDSTITQLPSASAAADSVVPSDNFDGTVTSKVTMASIAALGGGPPAAHASTHSTGQSDAITPAAIGAVADNDARLTNSRTPTSHASSHASAGSDPITPASIGAASSSHTHLLAAITDAGTAASRNVPGSGDATATQVVLGSDTRLSDSRTPTAHATSHRSTGADYPAPVCVSPSSLGSSQNNWSPGTADVIYVTSSTAVNITGLAASAVDGFCVLLMNANASGGSAITLVHESSSSTAANRFRSAYGANVILYADGGSATLVYHAASARWRIL